MLCIKDYESQAKRILPRMVYDYYASGADNEETLKENEIAFSRWVIRPRVLVDVSTVSLETKVMRQKVASPIFIAPSAMHKLAHPDGEIATAQAAADTSTMMMLSTASTVSLEDVAQACKLATPPNSPFGDLLWFQLYVFKDRDITKSLVKRAEKAGYKALVVTVDAPVLGKRRADIRNQFHLPPHLKLANLEKDSSTSTGLSTLTELKHDSALQRYFINQIDAQLTWQDIKWLRKITKLPIIVKGIMTKEDAAEALKWGVNGIVVSNHGGRQLDSAPATMDILEEIVDEVKERCDVFMDGGIRTGGDIFKALALGAKAVLIGRPILWGLAADGREGVRNVLKILREELSLTMALSGCAGVGNITRDHITYCKFGTISSRL